MRSKNWLFLAIVLVGMLVLAACGGSNNEPANTSTPDPTPTPTPDQGANGDEYPSERIDMLIGFGAGGGTDVTSRMLINALNENGIVDQTFVVQNMPGAGGSLALQEMANREGNEYTLISIPEYGSGLWNENVREGITLDNYTPIAQMATDYLTIVVRDDSPWETFEDLAEAMIADPGDVTITLASSLDGGEPWRWTQLADELGVEGELGFVTTDGGVASLTALLGGHSDVVFATPALAADHIETGDLRMLAVMIDDRAEQFPDVPSIVADLGYETTYYRYRGFWAAAGISDEVKDFWVDALEQAFETDEWKAYAEDAGLLHEFLGPDEYRDMIQRDGDSYQEYFHRLQQ